MPRSGSSVPGRDREGARNGEVTINEAAGGRWRGLVRHGCHDRWSRRHPSARRPQWRHHGCVEPPTKGNRATSGDLNVLVCLKGAEEDLVEHPGAEGTGRSRRSGGIRCGRRSGRPRRSRSRWPGWSRWPRRSRWPGRADRAAGRSGRHGPPGPAGQAGATGPSVLLVRRAPPGPRASRAFRARADRTGPAGPPGCAGHAWGAVRSATEPRVQRAPLDPRVQQAQARRDPRVQQAPRDPRAPAGQGRDGTLGSGRSGGRHWPLGPSRRRRDETGSSRSSGASGAQGPAGVNDLAFVAGAITPIASNAYAFPFAD